MKTTPRPCRRPCARPVQELRVPYKSKEKPASQKDANQAHARLRGQDERANAQLKSWRIFASSAPAPGGLASRAKPSMFFRRAKSEDEKGSSNVPGGWSNCRPPLLDTTNHD